MIHDFDNAIKLKGDERKAEIVERLNDYEDKDDFLRHYSSSSSS